MSKLIRSKKSYLLILAVTIVWSIAMFITMGVTARAAINLTVPGEYTGYLSGITSTNTYKDANQSASISGNVVTFSATGYSESGSCGSSTNYATTTTVALTAKVDIVVTFTAENTTANIGGTAVSSPATLSAGGSLSFTVTSPEGAKSKSASFTIVSIEAAQSDAPEDCARYYIAGAPTVTYDYLDEAIAAAGDTGTIVVTKSGKVYHSDGETTEFDIPSGVTLIVPYSSSDISVQTETKIIEGPSNSTLEYANTKLISAHTHPNDNVAGNILMPYNEVTYTLTIPVDTTVNVTSGSKFIIGGTLASGHISTSGVTSATAGAHSNVELQGTINVQSGGILSSCGYILGDGQLNVNGGGTVYQPFVLMAHRSGPYVVAAADGESWPVARYTLLNIQSDIHMESGSMMKGYMDIYTSTVSASIITVKERHNINCMPVIGPKDSLVNVTGTLDISYDASRVANDTAHNATGLYDRVGTTIMTFSGGASMGEMTARVNAAGSDHSMPTGKDYFPVPYNYIINLTNGDYDIAHKLNLHPGAEMYVAADANLIVSTGLAVMPGFQDHSNCSATVDNTTWYSFHYPSTAVLQASGMSGSGNLIVDGTMTVTGTFGGLVQTNGTGTVIMNGTNALDLSVGSKNQQKIMGLIDAPVTGRSVFTLKAQLYSTYGGLITMEKGRTYQAVDNGDNLVESYSYKFFKSNTENSPSGSNTVALNQTVIGTWKCAEGSHSFVETSNTATCTEPGVKTLTCACGDTKTEESAPKGHSYANPVVSISEDGKTYTVTVTCSVCAEGTDGHTKTSEVLNTTVLSTTAGDCKTNSTTTYQATGIFEGLEYSDTKTVAGELGNHNWQDATCTTAKTCSVCGATEGESLGHNTDGVIDHKDATCTEPGVVGGTYCTRCGEGKEAAEKEIPATDHAWDNGCDTECNNGCGHTREPSHTPNADDGDCTTAVTCSVCGTVTTAAKEAHIPAEDDGDCTTAVKCVNCEQNAVAAKDAHVAGEDDGNCTTAVKCVNCEQNAVAAKEAHVAGEDDGDCTTAVKCVNCDKIAVEANGSHTPNEDDGDCTTAITCSDCGTVTTPAKEAHTPAEGSHNCGYCGKPVTECGDYYVTYGDGYIVITNSGIAALKPSTFIQNMSVSILMERIDSLAAWVAEKGYTNALGKEYVDFCYNLGLDPNTMTAEQIANSYVLYAANNIGAMSEEEIYNLIFAEDGSGFDRAVLAYAMVTAYAYATDEAVMNELDQQYEVLEFFSTLADIVASPGFISYFESRQGEKDLAAFSATMEMICRSFESTEAVDKILSEGFASDDFIILLEEVIENYSHDCGVCGAQLTECMDDDNNHKCDLCDETLSECADDNNDHKCDVCDATLSECADDNNDHKCDVCDKPLSECADNDNDHNCDVCGKPLSECADGNNDHNCDVCGKPLSECADNDNDHNCDICSEMLSDHVDNNNDRLCDICGVRQLISFQAANVTANNSLDMLFAVSKNAIADWTGHYIKLVRTYADGTQDIREYPFEEWQTSGSMYFVTYDGLYAYHMCDEITLVIYNAHGEAVSTPWVDSMKAYALRRFDQVNAATKAVFVEMLYYGAAAQTHFGYDTDNLATDGLEQKHIDYVTESKEFKTGLDQGDKWAGSNLVVKSNINFLVAFKGMNRDMYAVVEFTKYNGRKVSVTINGENFGYMNGAYYITLPSELAIADARQEIVITIYNSDGTQYTECHESIEDYLARRSSVSSVFAAFMKYADAAYAYFNA